jgi:hypothetical protein
LFSVVGAREGELAEKGRRMDEMTTRGDLTATRSLTKGNSTRAMLYALGFLLLLTAWCGGPGTNKEEFQSASYIVQGSTDPRPIHLDLSTGGVIALFTRCEYGIIMTFVY